MANDSCSHVAAIGEIQRPDDPVCEECVKTDGRWVHLRTCQECGRTHCCDSSPHRHASGHFRDSGHPVVASAEDGERWLYCYPDGVFATY